MPTHRKFPSRDRRRVHVCIGHEGHIAELALLAARASGSDTWTINLQARAGDLAVFYIIRPISSFVAVGTVLDAASRELGQREGWPRHAMSHIGHVRMLHPQVSRKVAQDAIPDWRYLKTPQKSAGVPPEFEKRFLKLLGIREASDARGAGSAKRTQARGAGFGETERNRVVEAVAMDVAETVWGYDGFAVTRVDAQKCGYDLECKKANGMVFHVEVKGIAGSSVSFFMTRKERETAEGDRYYVVTAVTNALEPNLLQVSRIIRDELLEEYEFTPTAFRVRPKRR